MASDSSPDDDAASSSESIDPNEVIDFFSGKGAIEITCELIESPKQFSTLSETVYVSPSTLTKRLEEGRKIGLWYERIAYRGEKKIKVYEIKEGVEDIVSLVDESGMPEIIEQRRELERRQEARKNSLFKKISEQGD